MQRDEADVFAAAVFGYFEQIEEAEEAGGAGEVWGDVGKADGFDRVHLDLAFFHAVAGADGDVGARPDADAAGDLAAPNSFAKAFGERHGESLTPLRLTMQISRTGVVGCRTR